MNPSLQTAGTAPTVTGPIAHPLHALPTEPWLVEVLTLAALGSLALVALGLAGLLRRRSVPFLLVALALGTLLARSAVAVLTLHGVVPTDAHHVLEHGLDVAMAALVLGAVYYARQVERRSSAGGTP